MRTTAGNHWVWVFAGALPALALGAGCGDDTTATTTGTSQGGFGGFGGGDSGTPTSTSTTTTTTTGGSTGSTTSQSSSSSSSSQGGNGGAGDGGGGAGPGPGSGGGGAGQGGDPGTGGGGAGPGTCSSDADCDDLDTACRDYSCDLGTNECTDFANINEGGLVDGDVLTDCSDLRCVAGVATLVDDDTETPSQQEADECTVLVCDGGDIISEPGDEGGDCGNGGQCLDGTCVECTDVSDCGTDLGPCEAFACIGNQCVPDDPPAGTVVDAGDPNDCVSSQCDGFGNESVEPDDGESPVDDGNECTQAGVCQDGSAVYPNEPNGTPCTDGGVECAAGVCGPAVLLGQDFDTLPNTGTPTLADLVTALNQGWVLANTNNAARVGTGSSNAGGIYSFGADADTDRALGGVASGGTGTNAWGVCFTNSTGASAATINVSYDGEQWRDGGNASQTAQSITFSVSTFVTSATLSANIGTASTGDRTTGWEDIAALGFTSPVFTNSSGVAIDGNTAGRVAIAAVIPGLNLADGASACVRWLDPNDSGNDHGLGVDNLVITGE